MTKGEAYRQYYQANKAKILEANKQRARQRREHFRASPEEAETFRDKQRQKEVERRMTHYRATLEALIDIHHNTKWSAFYTTLLQHPHLEYMTPKTMEFLRQLGDVVEPDEQKHTVE